ncbi:phosphopantetheine-binding protein [Kitasatospora sp. NPDC059973]|uniref:phosphopantetheine-binding protein n=1 Tax=Kitasatospora sp. NPDC059973 TaxID=3347020 RepID=UPI0036A5FC4F
MQNTVAGLPAETVVDVTEIAESLEVFVRAEGRIDDGDQDFNRQVDLFDAGYLDSLGTLHLIQHIEERFRLELDDDALGDPGFGSIDGISSIVATALAAAGSRER